MGLLLKLNRNPQTVQVGAALITARRRGLRVELYIEAPPDVRIDREPDLPAHDAPPVATRPAA